MIMGSPPPSLKKHQIFQPYIALFKPYVPAGCPQRKESAVVSKYRSLTRLKFPTGVLRADRHFGIGVTCQRRTYMYVPELVTNASRHFQHSHAYRYARKLIDLRKVSVFGYNRYRYVQMRGKIRPSRRVSEHCNVLVTRAMVGRTRHQLILGTFRVS